MYRNLEDSIYNVLDGLFPNWRTIFAFGSGPEPQTPYCVIDVQEVGMIGRECISTLAHPTEAGTYASVTTQDNLATVSFKIIGKQDTTASEMVNLLQASLRTPKGYELLTRNNLSIYNVTKFPRTQQKRDTDVYMVYELMCKFAYCNVITEDIDWIESTTLDATYHDQLKYPSI
ncbi:phage neck terminator protein [Pseudomonas sp.]